MADKKIVLLLNASQEYIRHTGDDERKFAAQTNRLFEALTEVYIPLLKMIESLIEDGVDFKLCLVLSPVLCNLLEDPVIQNQYIVWLDEHIVLGQKEIARCESNSHLLSAAKFCLEKFQEAKLRFLKYNQKIVKKIYEFKKKGFIELLATCGTDIFFPHYNDIPEVISAQVETGINAYRASFGELPDGFWIPELGYYPRVEKIIRAYDMNYTVIDARNFLFSDIEPKNGIFSPARFSNALPVFARDFRTDSEIFEEGGYAANPVYLDKNKDVGGNAPLEYLAPLVSEGTPRYSMGFKYWKKRSQSDDGIYNYEEAVSQCEKDAADFLAKKSALLNNADKILNKNPDSGLQTVSLLISVSLNQLCENWFEGVYWIECMLRSASKYGVSFDLAKNIVGKPQELQKINPYFGSAGGVGYGENLLSSKNNWMIRYVRKASKRMVDLSERFPTDTGLKARLLNLGAKELMMAQSCGWAKMIHNNDSPKYASMRFTQSINDFTAVFDALGSNTVSTEWLTNLENQHQLFPWMNYRIFNRKR